MRNTSPILLSPIADRDLLVMGGLCAFAAALLVVNADLVLAAGLAVALIGAGWHMTPPDGWVGTGIHIVGHPTQPGLGLSPPWTVLAGHPVAYWTVAILLLALTTAAATPLAGLGWRRWGPTP